MYRATKAAGRHEAFTLVEMLVVIAIILAIAALAAAFAPRVSDNQNLTRAVDQLEQWLLTAKMRAKRDQLATGIRFIPDPANAGMFSEFQYIQQPDPLSGGWFSGPQQPPNPPQPPGSVLYSAGPPAVYLHGGICTGTSFLPPPPNPPTTQSVHFLNVDFTGGMPLPGQYLVQPGDYLEMQGGGGVYYIGSVLNQTTLALGPGGVSTAYELSLTVPQPTTNYRIHRQPRILIGEPPLQLPVNFAVDPTTFATNVQAGPSGFLEILFAPSGAVIGTNAGNGKLLMYIHDINQTNPDPNQGGIVAVQTRTGFIGAYSVAPGADPYLFAEEGRESGL